MITSDSNMNSYNADAMNAFKFYVESQTNGEVAIRLSHGTTICATGRECFEAMQVGAIDIYQSNIGEPANFWPPFAVLDLPYIFANDKMAECIFDQQDFLDKLRKGLQSKVSNVRLMIISNSGGWRHFSTTNKEITKPSDLKGMKIRTIPSEVQKKVALELGATPTGISWAEVYTSLGTGIIEGSKNGITDIVKANLHDYLKFMTLDGHAYMGGTWWMSDSRLASLTPEQQRIIIDGFDVMNQYLRGYPRFHEIRDYKIFQEKGGKIYVPSAEEKKAFQEATVGVQEWFVGLDPENAKWLEEFKAVCERCEGILDADYAAKLQ